MVYTSKRNKFKNFFKTRNMKYYGVFLALLVVVIAVVIVISHRNKSDSPSDNMETTSEMTYETVSQAETPAAVSGKYMLRVNLTTNKISVYEWNSEISDYNEKPFRFMICSADSGIKAGQYAGLPGDSREIWHSYDNYFYRYYVEFSDNLSFHSAAYEEKYNAGSLIPDNYEKLNTGKNENGILLFVADAKWIYENCSNESVVEVFEGDDEFPDEASYNKYIALPESVSWDPTDTAKESPWCRTKIKSLTSLDALTLKLNASEEFMLSFAKALDENDNDISDYVYYTGKYDKSRPGVYEITYNLIDIYGNHLTQNVSVTIEEPETETESETESVPETKSPTSDSTENRNETGGNDSTVEQKTENMSDNNLNTTANSNDSESTELQPLTEEDTGNISETKQQ